MTYWMTYSRVLKMELLAKKERSPEQNLAFAVILRAINDLKKFKRPSLSKSKQWERTLAEESYCLLLSQEPYWVKNREFWGEIAEIELEPLKGYLKKQDFVREYEEWKIEYERKKLQSQLVHQRPISQGTKDAGVDDLMKGI
jgi:hypothetical protein